MPFARLRRVTACACAMSLVLAATALAEATSDTEIAVSPRVQTVAPATSPAAFPGVTGVREGARLPRGWVVVGRHVKITRGDEAAFAALRMTCPTGKTWRSGTSDGEIAASVLDHDARKKHSVLVMATFSPSQIGVGESAAGTVYALCR
jgi:hypothetical protein